MLFDAAASCGLNADDGEEATRSTLKSGLDDGMKCPHPDLDEPAGRAADRLHGTDSAGRPGRMGCRRRRRNAAAARLAARQYLRAWLPEPLFAEGGTGKTALRYAQFLSLATGKSLTGDYVFERCRC